MSCIYYTGDMSLYIKNVYKNQLHILETRGKLRKGEMEKLRKLRIEPREELKKLPGEEAEKVGIGVIPYKNDTRF
jgi:hypothetical protein